ncbi:MAG TPA: glutamate--tRNA ligase family protein [Puia sp.]|nr:glutamate--tRNA ligase family protein [Puia sp.]
MKKKNSPKCNGGWNLVTFDARMDEQQFFTRTRIAPTPSGFLHLGNVLSFALTAALARKVGARILLRIDDLDQERVDPAYVQDVFDTLDFLDIPWDEGPRNFVEYEKEYSQLHRMEFYQEALELLKESGHVFACTCSRTGIIRDSVDGSYPGTCRQKGLPFDGENTGWRLRTEEERELSVKTLGDRLVKTPLPKAMSDFLVRKKDGFPAYQLTSLIDDLYYGVDFIVRGEDLWHSTLAQHYLAFPLLEEDRFQDITFYHHPLLTDAAGSKLSKSAGDTSIQYLRQQGWSPADVYSWIAGKLKREAVVKNWDELSKVLELLP